MSNTQAAEPVDHRFEPEVADQSASYRTRWLMAHNRLHELVHSEKPLLTRDDLDEQWLRYLEELKIADKIAVTTA